MESDKRFEQYLGGVQDRLFSSVVVEAEIVFGIGRLAPGRKKTKLERDLKQILALLSDVLPVTRSVAARYARVKVDLWERGKPMAENDLWIASTALDYGLTVVTRDIHFRQVPGLDVEDWLQ